jgi:hypothetical protein
VRITPLWTEIFLEEKNLILPCLKKIQYLLTVLIPTTKIVKKSIGLKRKKMMWAYLSPTLLW